MERRFGRDPLALAGWLFADLMLAAAIIFLASTPGVPASAFTTPTPTPTMISPATPTPSPPTPTPTPQACQRTVTLVRTDRTAPNSAGNIPTIEQLQQVPWNFGSSVAGLVLTYVHAPGVGQGQVLANEVNRRLQDALPALFPRDAIYEPFDYVDANASNNGSVLFQIYLVSESCK